MPDLTTDLIAAGNAMYEYFRRIPVDDEQFDEVMQGWEEAREAAICG
jgi:hypothetical protein